MGQITPEGVEAWWDKFFMRITGKKPTRRLGELVKSKWPKLYEKMYAKWGFTLQAGVTGLLDQSGVDVVGEEYDCDCAECAGRKPEDGPHDVDVLVRLGGHEVPVQVGVVYGARVHDDDVVDERGAVDVKTANERDTKLIRKKIRQTSPGGITLLATTSMVSPSDDDWWYEGVDGRCVVLWKNDSYSIYYGAGGRVEDAKELCKTFGCRPPYIQSVKARRSPNPKHEGHLDFSPKTADGLADAVRNDVERWTADPDDVIGALYYPAYARAYFNGLRRTNGSVRTDCLVDIMRHVVERHEEAAREKAVDKEGWWRSVSDALGTLEDLLAEYNSVEFSENTLTETCRMLQDVASRRYDDQVGSTLSRNEIYARLHLQALFCLTCAVIYRLRERTPPDILETLTAAARRDGKDGREHRIVLGCALFVVGLRQAIPGWYAENESLLFGKDSPDGMNSVLMRACSHVEEPVHIGVAYHVFDAQTMKKYHSLVLEALKEEMQHIKRWESETGNRWRKNHLVGHFMRHVLYGSRCYEIGDSVRSLSCIGPDAVSIAGHECGFLIHDENTEEELVKRAVQFWEAVLDSSPEPKALYGFGWGDFVKSIDQDTWERLMLLTCEAAGGRVEDPYGVIDRALSGGNPTEGGKRIIELIRRAGEGS